MDYKAHTARPGAGEIIVELYIIVPVLRAVMQHYLFRCAIALEADDLVDFLCILMNCVNR